MRDKQYIKQLLDEWVKGSYEIVDGIVNVEGSVHIRDWKEDRLSVQFGIVTGYFSCSENKLVSLAGAPEEVCGNFWCQYNQLTSLKGAPKEVGGNFWCNNNQLVSLVGSPKVIGRNFYCQNNRLVSLEGAPKKVGGVFVCSYNPFEFL